VVTTTLVGDVYMSKTEALSALAALLDIPVDTTDPAHAHLVCENGVVVAIEVPKFGEDLPLTLDLTGQTEADVAVVRTRLIDHAKTHLSWTFVAVG